LCCRSPRRRTEDGDFTDHQVALGAGIALASGDDSTNLLKMGVLSTGSGQVAILGRSSGGGSGSSSSIRNGFGALADRIPLDLDVRHGVGARHGGRSERGTFPGRELDKRSSGMKDAKTISGALMDKRLVSRAVSVGESIDLCYVRLNF
jgi:hypothetical protein